MTRRIFRRDRLPAALFLLGSALAAFILRALPWRNYLAADGSYLFFGPDSYDHLRRISLGLKAFPFLPPYDYYYGYPKGMGQVWAPLFDYLIAAAALAAGSGAPSPETVESIAFWLPPALSFCTVFMVYAVGRRLFGRRAGLTAALLLAILPAHILYSFVSRLDHHVAEPMLCLALMGSLLKGVDRAGATPVRAPLSPALAMVFALLVWRGSVIFWGIAFLALFLHLLALGVTSDEGRATAGFASLVHFFAALILLPLCLVNFSGTAAGITAGIVSWFHVLLLGVCAFAFYLLTRLSRSRGGIILATLLCAAAIILAASPVGRVFSREFLAGIDIIVGRDPWLASISELVSILYYKNGNLDLWYPVENFSLLYWLFPLAVVLLVGRWRSGGWREFRYPLFIVWGTIFWVLPLFRLRYCHLTAVTLAISGGFLLSFVADRFTSVKWVPQPRLLAGGILFLLVLPILSLLRIVSATSPEPAVKDDLMTALRWLRDNTPATSFYDRPDAVPEYGVLADWSLGAHMVNVARRPALATNFGWETHGLYESAAFQSLGDPEAAEEILRTNRIRYILLNQTIGTVEDERAIAAYGFGQGKFRTSAATPFHLLRSMHYRLLARDGVAYAALGTTFAPLGHYRLIYEAANTATYPGAGQVSLFKIFEYLPGAIISGTGPKSAPVELELRLQSPIDRVLTYRDEGVVGTDGRFTFRVPYPTTVASGILKPLGEYTVRVGGRSFSVRATEDEVYGGRVVAMR